jgi:hypothetical protein
VIPTTVSNLRSFNEDQGSRRLVLVRIQLGVSGIVIMISEVEKSGFEVCSCVQLTSVHRAKIQVIVHRTGGEAFSEH